MQLPDFESFAPIAGVEYELEGMPVRVVEVRAHENPEWKNLVVVEWDDGGRHETLTAGRTGYGHYWKAELLKRRALVG